MFADIDKAVRISLLQFIHRKDVVVVAVGEKDRLGQGAELLKGPRDLTRVIARIDDYGFSPVLPVAEKIAVGLNRPDNKLFGPQFFSPALLFLFLEASARLSLDIKYARDAADLRDQ